MDKAHVHYCWRASEGGGGREDLWSALCLLGRSAPTRQEQGRGVLSPCPSPTPTTSLPKCSLRTHCPKPEGETPPKRSWVASFLAGNEVGWCGGMCRGPQGQRWEGKTGGMGTAMELCLAPTAPHPGRADVSQQAQHRDRTHRLEAEARTVRVRAAGSYWAETAISQRGLQEPKGVL